MNDGPEPVERTLHPLDVQFDRIGVWGTSAAGTRYLRWIPFGMPKLGHYELILKSVAFLYNNAEDAKVGRKIGGTGFFVSVPSEKHGMALRYTHCVTNRHVAVYNKKGAPSPVIRINGTNGAPDIRELDPAEWISPPGWHDIAVSPPIFFQKDTEAISLDAPSWWFSEEEEAQAQIGEADDVFMIGRFIDYDGAETNVPAVRFGHISIMNAKIKQDATGFSGRSIVIDMHSRTGFSGSPVFVYRTLGSYFLEPKPGTILTGDGGHMMKLLGIHWGQFPELWELEEMAERKTESADPSLITAGKYVKGMSGMSCVIPSAVIRDLVLNNTQLKAMRATHDEQYSEYVQQQGLLPRAESGAPPLA